MLLADNKKLYGLDLNATKKPKVVFKKELEFKRKMGKADIAAKGLGAVTATMAVASAGGARTSSSYSTSQAYADSALNITSAFQNSVAKRYAAAEKARSVAFFLTKEEEGMVLLGINLGDGNEVGRIPMDEKEPQFMVDDIGNRVYYFRNKTELLAYDF